MASKIFRVHLSVVYNNEEITEDTISDNLWEVMKNIDPSIVLLNVDNIKRIVRPKQSLQKMIKKAEKNAKNNNIVMEKEK